YRPRDAADAEAAVTVEVPVLDGDERLRHVRRQVGEGDGGAAFLEELCDEPAVVAEDARGLLGFPDVDLGDGRAVAAHRRPGADTEPRQQGERRHQGEPETGQQAGASPQPVVEVARAITELTHGSALEIRSSPFWSVRG